MGPPRWNGRPRRDGAGGLRPRGRRGGRPRRPTGLVRRSLRRARSGLARERQRGLPPSSHRRREARTAEARRVGTFAPEELPPLGFDQGRSSETRSGVERKRSRQRLSGFRPFRGPADSPPQAFSHTNPPSFRIVHSSGSSPDRPTQLPDRPRVLSALRVNTGPREQVYCRSYRRGARLHARPACSAETACDWHRHFTFP